MMLETEEMNRKQVAWPNITLSSTYPVAVMNHNIQRTPHIPHTPKLLLTWSFHFDTSKSYCIGFITNIIFIIDN